ncbi:hypothetical protein DAPPUDRAFT_327780 [Daphnia pulex]|uniref:Zinc finger PHD-type domain-containing protein n=1 Tax=Daphnia pulex TaxID=6669 RepID=E9HBR5_DAPPU|nr:hypothetical protein DAPPUDRAFT_327780 [Daphnia pulex]|eukprot:EFX70765.1 hypothetical protein DAPPUDRAFT_327780 [Daphnia pulex]
MFKSILYEDGKWYLANVVEKNNAAFEFKVFPSQAISDTPPETIYGNVFPSQAISDTPHSPWAAIGVDDCVIYAHCTCAVGLGEVCNHIGCLLLVSGTYKDVREMGRVRKQLLPTVRKPTNEENCDLIKKSAEMPGKPAAFFLLQDNCSEYLPPALKVKLPKPLTSMFQKDAIGLSLPELITKTYIGSHTDPSGLLLQNSDRFCIATFVSPSISLLKQICYPEAFQFTSEATSWGMKNECIAMTMFEAHIRKSGKHPGFQVTKTGMFISVVYPFLSSSPDRIFCSPALGCCTIEIKCPFNWRYITVKKGIEYPNASLCYDKEKKEYHMNKAHDYYYRVQLQMYTTGYRFAFFVVYTMVDLMYIEVPYDHCFMEEFAIPRATKYFQNIIMPEIISGYFYKNSFFHSSSVLHKNQYLPCYCQTNEPVIVLLVFCSNENCKLKMFHLKCIHDRSPSLKRITKSWSCDTCKKVTRSVREKEKRVRANNQDGENQTNVKSKRASTSRIPLRTVNK